MAGANDVDPGNLGNAQSSNGDADRVGSNSDGDDRALQPSRHSAQIVPSRTYQSAGGYGI